MEWRENVNDDLETDFAHTQERRAHMLDWSREEGRIAIGWGKIGDASRYSSPEEITKAINEKYGSRQEIAQLMEDEAEYRPGPNSFNNGGYSLWNLYNEMKEGDLVILITKNSRRALVVEVKSEKAEWKPEREPDTFDDYQHQREVSVRRDKNPDELWNQAASKSYLTLSKLSR